MMPGFHTLKGIDQTMPKSKRKSPKSKQVSLNRLEQIKRLEKDIIADPKLLDLLVSRPEEALEKLHYLDADLKANIGNISLFELLAGLTGVLNQLGSNCGPSSCGTGSTCTATCTVANSCTDTCRTSTCDGGATIALPHLDISLLENLTNYSDQLKGLDERVFKPFILRF